MDINIIYVCTVCPLRPGEVTVTALGREKCVKLVAEVLRLQPGERLTD